MSQHYDENEILQEAIRRIRPELSRLFGAKWPRIEQALESLLAQLAARQGTTVQEQTRLRNRIRRLFFREEMRAAFQLQKAEQQVRREREPTRSISKGILQSGTRGTSQTSATTSPTPTVTRYVDVACPRQWTLDQGRTPVTVRFTLLPSAESDTDEETAVDLITNEPVRIYLQAPGFVVTDGNQRTLTVPPFGDSDAVAFHLKPDQLGEHKLEFHFFQRGNPIGEARVTVQVYSELPGTVPAQPGGSYAQLVQFEPGLAPPDFTLFVARETIQGQAQLRFTLYRGDQELLPGSSVPLTHIARHYSGQLYRRLSDLTDQAAGKSLSGSAAAQADAEVRTVGRLLWDDLLHRDLKRLLRQNWSAWRDQSFLLISEEPDIPWELVWPNIADLPEKDDHPWCVHFRFGRWLRAGAQDETWHWLRGALSWQRWLGLIPTDSSLVFVQEEQRHLQTLLEELAVEDLSPERPTREVVERLLVEQPFSWLHVAAHGHAGADDVGDEALVKLEGWDLHPSAFVPAEVKAWMGRTRPGIFFNTCHGARQQWSPTGIGGWARRLIAAGAGLYLAPLWTVSDRQALPFAETFYRELAGATPVGAAVQAARTKAHAAGDPTWLAYSLFGHPNAQITL